MAVRDMGKVHAKPAVEAHASLVARDRNTVDRGAHVNSQRVRWSPACLSSWRCARTTNPRAPIGHTFVRPGTGCAGHGGRVCCKPKGVEIPARALADNIPAAPPDCLSRI